MHHLRRIIVSLAVLGAILVPAVPASAAFDPFGAACKASGAGGSSACTAGKGDPISGPNGILYKATQIIALIAGIAAVIVIIIGGFMYITSSGDSSKVSNAKRAIIYAVVGLIVIVLARSIILYVITKL